MKKFFYIFCAVFALTFIFEAAGQEQDSSLIKRKEILEKTVVSAGDSVIKITIRNCDISEFPDIKVIVEAYDVTGKPLDTLTKSMINVQENGETKEILSVSKITIKENVPVDFVFLIDVTGSMQKYVDATKNNIATFAQKLASRGISYRLGLILFSDIINEVHPLTDDVNAFQNWLEGIRAAGGNDNKENALEAIEEASRMEYRPLSNRVLVIITDAPFHQRGEQGGYGITNMNKESAIELMEKNEMRLFAIVPNYLRDYEQMTRITRGGVFNIQNEFSTVLDLFSSQLSNLYYVKYRTGKEAIPYELEIAILDEKNQQITKKKVPIVEIDGEVMLRLLYKTGSAALPDSVPELEIISQFMKNKPNVAILVEGHTDSVGSYALNDALSERRAASVKTYLVNKGINPLRIKTKGYGERKPLYSNATENGRYFNRRTVIRIIEK